MKALRFHGQKDIRLEEIEVPKCGKAQIKVKPAFVGICGTDLNEYLGGASIMPTIPHAITGEQVPLTMGHEFSGIVEEVGDEILDVKPGDRVVIQPIIYDGTCGACREGYINCCDGNGFVGLSGWGGGLSEHVVLPRHAIYHIPENVSMEVGALVEPLAVAWHAVKVSPFKKGDAVLILGGGPIGLAVIQTLKVMEAGTIIVSEIASRRREFAKRFGADYVLDPTKEDIPARVREICDNKGAHIAYDAAGVQIGFDQAISSVRARGTIVNIAVWEKRATFIPNHMNFRERKYMGIATYLEGDFQEVIDAISSGRLNPGPMITSKIKMDHIEEDGFKRLIHDKDNQVKILVDVNA